AGNPLNPRSPRLKPNIDARLDSRLDEAMKTRFILTGCIALLSLTLVCPAPAADTKIEQALRDLDAQWSKDAGAKDIGKTVSYYAEGAIVMPPNAASATTKDAIGDAGK